MSLLDWDTNPANNTSKPGINWSEGQLPGTVNGSARGMMSDVATWLLTPTFPGATTLTVNGQAVWTAGNFTPSNYALLSGATFTGNVSIRGNITTLGPASASPGTGANIAFRDDTASARWGVGILGTSGATNFSFYNVPAAVEVATLQPSGAFTIAGQFTAPAIAATFNMTVAGQAVWHAGNFNPATYAPLASPALTGVPTAPTAAGGTNTTQIATTAFVAAAIPSTAGFAQLSGANFTGALQQNGNQVWHAGNLTPGNYLTTAAAASTYAPIASPTFTGTVTVPTLQLAAGITARASGGKMILTVGGSDVASLDSSGNLRVLGNITAAAGSL